MTDDELMMVKVSENLEGYQELLEAVYEETRARTIHVAIRGLKDAIKALRRSNGLDELVVGAQATKLEVEELVSSYNEEMEDDGEESGDGIELEGGGIQTIEQETEEEDGEEGEGSSE